MTQIPKGGTLVPGGVSFPVIREAVYQPTLVALNAMDVSQLYVGMLGVVAATPGVFYTLTDLTPTWTAFAGGGGGFATWKEPVRTASTINQGTPPQNGGNYGGVTVADGDRVLILSNQALPATSGIWVVSTTGLWTRPTDFNTGNHATASAVFVQEGSGPSSKRGVTYVCNTPPPADIIGTDQTDWIPIAIGGREVSPGTVIYDDNSAGGGISTTNVGVGILSYGSPVLSLGADLGGYPYVAPALDYSRLGVNPALGPYWQSWGESSVRQMGSRQYDYPAALVTPVISAVFPTGVSNSVTRGYKIVGYDSTPPGGSQFGGTTAASVQSNDAGGATVQDGSNYETVTWVDVVGAVSYDIYLVFSSIGETLGKVGNVAQGTQQFLHQGQIGDGSTPPAIRTPHIDTYNGMYQVIPLTENIALDITTGGGGFPVTGGGGLQAQTIRIGFKQGAGAPWQVTWPSNVELTSPAELRGVVGKIDIFNFVWDMTKLKWVEDSRSQIPTKFNKDPVLLCGGLNSVFPFTGTGWTIDGVSPLTVGDRVLVSSNAFTPAQVGIYIVRAGLWDRPYDYQDGDHAQGASLQVLAGASRAGQVWRVSTLKPNDVINTDVINWVVGIVGGISPGPVVGGTAYADAGTNTGADMYYFLYTIYHSGVPTFSFRGEPGGGCLFAPSREDSNIGIAETAPYFTSAWRRVCAKMHETIHTDVAFSATPTFDVADLYKGTVFSFTFTGNVTGWAIPTPPSSAYGAGVVHDIEAVIYLQQDGTGGWTFTGTPANVKLRTGFAIGLLANEITAVTLRWNRFLAAWCQTVPEVILT